MVRVWIAGKILELGMETKFTALVLLHRYWNAFESIIDTISHSRSNTKEKQPEDDWKWVASACLFLACKAEEEPRRLRDVINVSYMLQFGIDGSDSSNSNSQIRQYQGNSQKKMAAKEIDSDNNHAIASKNFKVMAHDDIIATVDDDDTYIKLEILIDPPPLDDSYWQAKEQLVATEQRVLRWLHFDVLVSHPHRMVLIVVKELLIMTVNDKNHDDKSITQPLLPDQDEVVDEPLLPCPRLISQAWQRLNDSLFYAPALTHPAMQMACVAISLAATALVETGAASEAKTESKRRVSTDQHESFPLHPSLPLEPIRSTSRPAINTLDLQRNEDAYPLAAEDAVLRMLQTKPTWWRCYKFPDREFHETQVDMCRATQVLGQMKVTGNQM